MKEQPRERRSRERGASMPEIVTATAVVAVLAVIGVPIAEDAHRAAALSRSIAQVHGLLVRCRATAVLRGRLCAVVFDLGADGSWRCTVAEDGDGDGVRRSDIHSGVDPVVGASRTLAAGVAGPGILDGPVPDPSGRGRLAGDPSDPVRAGRGNLVSFSAAGTATPSSIYFTDFSRRMAVLRVYGGTGRINRLSWQRGWREWR